MDIFLDIFLNQLIQFSFELGQATGQIFNIEHSTLCCPTTQRS